MYRPLSSSENEHRPPWRTAVADHCANCEIELRDKSYEKDGKTYCCEGCAMGGPCVC